MKLGFADFETNNNMKKNHNVTLFDHNSGRNKQHWKNNYGRQKHVMKK